MKITVLTDAKGKIVGTMEPAKGSAGSPMRGGMAAGHGQQIHEVDVSEAVLKDSLGKLHGRTVESLAK